MNVYTVGEVDYDVRREIPRAVYSTLAAAIAHVPDAIWQIDQDGGANGRCADGREWIIGVFLVDASVE